MREPFSNLAMPMLLAGTLLAGNAAAGEPLRMGGTGTSLGLLHQVGGEFSAGSKITIEIVPSLGSTGAIRALVDGKLDIAVSARPLKPTESAEGLSQVMVLRTAYVLATSHRNPTGLKTEDLPKIFAADEPTWADGTPIRIILRPRSESDTTLLGELFAGMDAAIEVARRRAEIPTAATDQDNADMAERIPGSLIGTAATQLKTEHRNLTVIPLNGVAPTLANFESRAYPFAKKLYFILRTAGDADARRFIDFLRSPPGEKALRETETLPGGE
jgi:phosphate transport system substrate-binding protein